VNARAAVAALWLANPESRIIVEHGDWFFDGRWYWCCGLCASAWPGEDVLVAYLYLPGWQGYGDTWREAYADACRHRDRHRKQLADMFKKETA